MLEDNAPKHISVNYFSKCLNKTGILQKRSECKGLHFGDVVEFVIAIEVCKNASENKKN